jgi:hypothetical protein
VTGQAANVTMQVDSYAGMKTVIKPDPGLRRVQVGKKSVCE